jgi:pantothenate kinase
MTYASWNLHTQKTDDVSLSQIAKELVDAGLAEPGKPRFLLGITGPPAAGKSTFATVLGEAINELVGWTAAVAVSMDGFHLPNAILESRGLRAIKGMPVTFDAVAFLALLMQLRQDPPNSVWCPIFDRTLDEAVAHSLEVPAWARIIIVEGNYLLLDDPPWNQVRPLFDQIWYLDVPMNVMIQRLLERHIAGGRTEREAMDKIVGTDLENARLIARTRAFADRILRVTSEMQEKESDHLNDHPESGRSHGKDSHN